MLQVCHVPLTCQPRSRKASQRIYGVPSSFCRLPCKSSQIGCRLDVFKLFDFLVKSFAIFKEAWCILMLLLPSLPFLVKLCARYWTQSLPTVHHLVNQR